MSAALRRLAAPPRAVAALHRAVAAGGASELDPGAPAALWRQALVGPAEDFLARPGKELRAAIVRAGWLLGGGAEAALPGRLPLAIELLHAGSLVIDDIEDGSDERRGAPALHRQIGIPLAINTGSWLYFWALAELAELGLPPDRELAAHRAAHRALVRCHQGQALDLAARVDELEVADLPGIVAATTRLKTGALCELAVTLGALAAGADAARAARIAGFGERVGVALQMLDDLGSLTSPARRAKGREDLRGGHPTWPWAWVAERADAAAWLERARELRAHPEGRDGPDGGDRGALADDLVDRLGDDLADAVALPGRARIRAAIEGALAAARAADGPPQAVAAIASELARMEASYG